MTRERTLAVRLREARMHRDMTQEELGEAVNVHPITISKYERGLQRPRARILIALAEFFEMSVDSLLREHGDSLHENLTDAESEMVLILSHPNLTLRVAVETLSGRAIADITQYVRFVLDREMKRKAGRN